MNDTLRLRIRFVKLGKIRFTSHRDVARMWERAFRRVGLPLEYSQGFSPRPRVSFGLALPTGCESEAEYLDVDLSAGAGIDLLTLAARLSEALPVGVDATAVTAIDRGIPSLQEEVDSSTWRWIVCSAEETPAIGVDDLTGRVAALLGSESVVVRRTRKGAETDDDIRPAILDLQVIGPAEPDYSVGVWLEAELASKPRSVRPSEVLSALGPGLEERLVRRTHQWILREGARREPLADPGDATVAPHALERAS